LSQNRIYTQDSAVIDAAVYAEDNITPVTASSVTWEFNYPSGVSMTGSSLPTDATTGQRLLLTSTVTIDTTPVSAWSVIEYDGATWTVLAPSANMAITDNMATISLPGSLTTISGLYRGVARFTLSDGTTRSAPVEFEVIDPLADRLNLTGADLAVEHAWMKLEDLFDSELGGPHLRDRTRNSFDRNKVGNLLPDALYTINNTYQPVTGYDGTSFPYETHSPLLSQALLVQSIRHLMRSYVEQWQPMNQNISYFDRRDYLNRWQQVFKIEDDQLNTWLDLFKRDLMGFGETSTLLGGYATWYGRYPRYMRGRYPYIYRF
jgi:hypothetical protein